MALVFAAITPHTPILVPTVGREHLSRLKKTTDALKSLEEQLVAAKPDVIVVIAPHGPTSEHHFIIDLNESYACNMKEFGIMDMSLPCRTDMKLTSDIRELSEDRGVPLMLRSEEALGYGVLIPLMYLAPRLGPFSLIPAHPSMLDAKSHFEFGKVLQEAILHTNRRVAVIGSADLSHRLSESAPGGFSPLALTFDDNVKEAFSNRSASALIAMEPMTVHEAQSCGYQTLVTFMGVMDHVEAVPEILAYESPFGVGNLTARYRLN